MLNSFFRRTLIVGSAFSIVLVGALESSAHAHDKEPYAMAVRDLGSTALELAHIDAQETADVLGVELIFSGQTEKTAEGKSLLLPSAWAPSC